MPFSPFLAWLSSLLKSLEMPPYCSLDHEPRTTYGWLVSLCLSIGHLEKYFFIEVLRVGPQEGTRLAKDIANIPTDSQSESLSCLSDLSKPEDFGSLEVMLVFSFSCSCVRVWLISAGC